MTDAWPIVCATGHRPKGLSPETQAWCRDKLGKAAVWLRDERGCTVGISGMALGVDTWWAQAVLNAGLDLWAYVPFPQQPDVWPAPARTEWSALLKRAAQVRYAGDLGNLLGEDRRRAAVRLLHHRNDLMLADSAAVVAVLDVAKRSGGTRSAAVKANRAGMPGVHLDPAAQTVRVGLPRV